MLPNIINNIELRISLEDVLKYYKAKEASAQTDAPRLTRHFCPFRRCQGDKHPHFVIEHEKQTDAYGKRIETGQHVNKGAVVKKHWRCDHSHVDGYGVVSLVAAINGWTPDQSQLTRDQWKKIIEICADIAGLPTRELDKEAVNGWLLEHDPQPQWAIRIADDFTPAAFRALSLDGMEGVSYKTTAKLMHEQFGLWQVENYTMEGCYPSGERDASRFKSYERRAHELFPIFVFAYDWENGMPLKENPEKRTDRWVARIVMPYFVRQRGEDFDWRNDVWAVMNSTDSKNDLREWNTRVLLLGDACAMETAFKRDAALAAEKIGEEVVTEKEQESEQSGKSGKSAKSEEAEEPKKIKLPADEVRLNKCVLCKTPLDAVSTYLWLNYPRLYADGKNDYYRNSFWHVAWLKGSDYYLNPWENKALSSIATDTFQLFGNDRSEIAMANANSMHYNYLRLCMLPTSMSQMDPVDSGCGLKHVPHSPLDFFRYYAPTMDEEIRNNMVVGSNTGVKALLLQKELNGSSSLKPFTRKYKKKETPGEKNYTYEINMAAAWQMMANKGYCRSIPEGSRSSIGQCYRIDGHFVYELDAESVMADMRKSLEDFAKDDASSVDDVEMMLNAMLRCKDLQYARNITKLPVMAMPKSESYGPELDYFFFRNGALEITPTSVSFRRYDELDFLIYRTQVMPFDYQPPFYGNHSPISIHINPEYKKRSDQYEEARRKAELSTEELYAMKQRLKDFATLGQWCVDIKPSTDEIDERIIVPGIVRNDKQHNDWLRWWPFLRLIRCWANEDWQKEESGQFTDGDRQALTARMANLMFTIGRCIYRYHDNVQYMPFFLENSVDREGKAQGGSGKSMLVQNFLGFARHILQVNAKNMSKTDDFANFFSSFVPHYHDVIHIEDFPRMAIDPFFNYATGKFEYRQKYADVQSLDRSESPMVVFTSNFVVQSTDESALGRIQFGGMSHYFSREVETYNKDGRTMDTIDPDFCYKPEDCSIEQRSQVIYTLAKCVQFCMVATGMKVKVAVPGNDLLERLSRTELGDTFYDWFTEFLERPYIFNSPISINEMFNEYRRYYDPSKARFDSVSRSKFYEGMQKYCAKPAHGVSFMPIKALLSASEQTRSKRRSADGTEKSYIRKGSSWITRTYIDDKGKIHHARVLSKNAGDNCVTGGAVWFSRRGEEPPTPEEFLRMIEDFAKQPDPAPILDADGNAIHAEEHPDWTMLNTEEEAEAIRKAGGVRRILPSATAAPVQNPNGNGGQFDVNVAPGEIAPSEPLPF